MDFIEGLPQSYGKDSILVVVDRLTKYSHFILLKHLYIAFSIAKVFFDNIYKLHGLPVSIVSDRDRIFTSNFWKELFGLTGVSLDMSSAYHPQTDGQTEGINQCLENYLRCMCHQQPKKWAQWITLAEFWFNTNFHSGLKATPFQALYGYPPNQLAIGPYLQCHHSEVEELMQGRVKLVQLLKDNLQQAQHNQPYADKKITEREFQIGDEVFLRLTPYKQTTVAMRRQLKLSAKYFGPYKVIEKIGNVAYKLALPPSSRIHPWSHSSPEQATWEDYHAVSAKFPDFDPWGQGGKDGGGSIATLSENTTSKSSRSMKCFNGNHTIKGTDEFGSELRKECSDGDVLAELGQPKGIGDSPRNDVILGTVGNQASEHVGGEEQA
ncbi:UNVERIFIED_CONTAM: Transposon Ty3-G Gag-Pol polyprotein [Sesamum angustifolium]|uniref:Transposon Ty3-G Gag-Pol polyprotein n=1 Tax=Sesamum angustifolium TaxID=2727405 RepID=A0AAW2LGX1_9LAMI